MSKITQLNIPENGRVILSPQGLHLMVTGLKKPLHQGDLIPFIFTFERAGAIQVKVPVEGR